MAKKPSRKRSANLPAKSDIPIIGEDDFIKLVKRNKAYRRQAQEASGDAGEMIKKAIETKHLDRNGMKGFNVFDRLTDDPAKLKSALAHFDAYRIYGKLDEIAAKQSELDIPRQELKPKNGKPASSKPDLRVVDDASSVAAE
jgi:hypothetical protein